MKFNKIFGYDAFFQSLLVLRAPPFYFQHWLFELLILRPSPGVAGFPGEISTAPG